MENAMELYKAAKSQLADNRDCADNLAEMWKLFKGPDGEWWIDEILYDYRYEIARLNNLPAPKRTRV